MTKKWGRTVAAAKAEESSAWSMIWAMAEEAFDRDPTYKNISSGPVIEEIRLELEDAGISLAFGTIKNRALVGKMAHGASKRDSDTLRSVPWTVVQVAVSFGATAEATAQVIRETRKARQQPTRYTMREAFRNGGVPEGDDAPRFSDDKYMASIASIAAHTMAERRGEYTPGPMARLAGSLLGEMLVGKVAVVDWDAQLADLIDAQDGA